MTSRIRLSAIVVLAGACLCLLTPQGPSDEPQLKVGEHQLSGPFVHNNLTICLIHGEDKLKDQKFLLLADALEQKKIIIYETQKVNELTMENTSEQPVVILSGDILKGGQQDRIAQFDQMVPAKSGKISLKVFCVERTAGRWMKPLTDADKTFTASPGQLCTNDLRLASRCYTSQSGVWTGCAKVQERLTASAKVDVKAKESDSSLALSLQVKEVEAAVNEYISKLNGLLKDKNDVVGYAFAINGKVLSSDGYGSPELFRKVWPRMLRASAIEAFAEQIKDKKPAAAKLQAFQTFLEEAAKGKETAKDEAKGLRQTTNEAARIQRFESLDPKAKSLRVQGIAY